MARHTITDNRIERVRVDDLGKGSVELEWVHSFVLGNRLDDSRVGGASEAVPGLASNRPIERPAGSQPQVKLVVTSSKFTSQIPNHAIFYPKGVTGSRPCSAGGTEKMEIECTMNLAGNW